MNLYIETQLFKTWKGLSRYIIRQSLQGWSLPTQILSQWKAEYDGFMNTLPTNVLYGFLKKKREIIGCVSFQSFYGRPAYNATIELSIYLEVSHRSKGLGKQVLRHAIEEAPKFGVKTILGYIFAHNEPSIKLFRCFGFEVWATLPNIASLDGVEKSLKIFGKRIA